MRDAPGSPASIRRRGLFGSTSTVLLSVGLACTGPALDDGGRIDDDAGVDAGVVDAGIVDGGARDAGVVDADGGIDAGVDVGALDAGGADVRCGDVVTLDTNPMQTVVVRINEFNCDLVLSSSVDATWTVEAPSARLSRTDVVEATTESEPGYLAPFVLASSSTSTTVTLTDVDVGEDVVVTFRRLGEPVSAVVQARSLAVTSAQILDDAAVVGLHTVMAAMSDDGHGGRLFARWFQTFATTAHSERGAPAVLVDELKSMHGADAANWDLSTLPFKVTGLHFRVDLANDTHCGEVRVSLASTHATIRPLHLIFLFRLPAHALDRSPSGRAHCVSTALTLARFSELSESDFVDAVFDMLPTWIAPSTFLLAESVEFTVSPWEWRQWMKVSNPDGDTSAALPFVVDNPPLFQTIDVNAVNTPGPKRSAFLAFVDVNAEALNARSLLLPESFRSASARVNDGVPWNPIDLTGVPSSTLSLYPNLRENMEIVGCPACHTADADFVQTREDRTFSAFYTKELLARKAHMERRQRGVIDAVPFGPLQDAPVFP